MKVFRRMDTERVIHEVKARECLWNPRNMQYKNKIEKYKAWEEVSEAVVPKFATCNEHEQSQMVRAVQSRWKTARDAYMKCRLTESKKPTYRSRQHRYIYQEQLKFLEQVKDTEEGRARDEDETSNGFTGENTAIQSTYGLSDDDVDEASDGVMDFDIDIHDDMKVKIEEDVTAAEVFNAKSINDDKEQKCLPETSSQHNDQKAPIAAVNKPHLLRKRPRNIQPRKVKTKMTEFETRLLKVLRSKSIPSPNTSALQADDQFFFNSLAPLLNNFNVHQKIKFRSKILEVVMEVENIDAVNVKQEIETYICL